MGARVRRESGWEEGGLQAAGMATKQQIKTEHDMDGEHQSDRLVFPMAALTHCYKRSALKQHEFILFTVLELRSLDSVSTSSSQGVLRAASSWGLWGDPPFPWLFFYLLLFICTPWLVTPSFILEASGQSVYLSSYCFFLWPTSFLFLISSSTFLPPSHKDHHIASGPPR